MNKLDQIRLAAALETTADDILRGNSAPIPQLARAIRRINAAAARMCGEAHLHIDEDGKLVPKGPRDAV